MDCRFCKLTNINNVAGHNYRCQHCGYSYTASNWDIFYDKMIRMPISSFLLASMFWFFSMVLGVILGGGFTSAALNTTILFLFLIGSTAFIFGLSTSVDYIQAILIYTSRWIKRQNPDLDEVKKEVQEKNKKKIVKEVTATSTSTYDEEKGTFVETDIRPGERKVPRIAPTFKAGLWTIITGAVFSYVYTVMFPPF